MCFSINMCNIIVKNKNNYPLCGDNLYFKCQTESIKTTYFPLTTIIEILLKLLLMFKRPAFDMKASIVSFFFQQIGELQNETLNS